MRQNGVAWGFVAMFVDERAIGVARLLSEVVQPLELPMEHQQLPERIHNSEPHL